MTVWIGTSGWSYDHWADVLYPPGTATTARLSHYLAEFDTVELNSSFYRWPRDAAFRRWQSRLPPGFRFTVKAPRGLTHAKKLFQPETWIERMRTGLHELGGSRGPLLVQLPPGMPRDDARLDYFLSHMPTWVDIAVEFRHPSWLEESALRILERHGAAYCVMSGADLPCVLRATGPFVYVRLHGPDPSTLYGGSYSEDDLEWWAEKISTWTAGGHDVYAYFDNDGGGHAVRNARRLRELVS